MLGMDLALLVGGAFITEIVFNLQGLGQWAVSSAYSSDLPALVGVTVVTAFAVAGAEPDRRHHICVSRSTSETFMTDESRDERLDRELIELLNELRVALPGVQVLFAFLLAVPFSQRFEQLTAVQEDVFFAAFLCTAVATALLIAPSVYHRLRWRKRDKDQILRTSNRLAIAGTAFLAAAIVAVVPRHRPDLRSRYVDRRDPGGRRDFGWLWYGLPLVRRWRAPSRS